MTIETNLNVAPYYDNFDPEKDYYKVLFRPGVALQTRELADVQSLAQQQIERLSNHVFKAGTIVNGVNFEYNPKYDYVKIQDLQVNGQPVTPSAYTSLMVRNSSNLIAQVVNYKSGYQSQDPDTNYLYLRYINSGNDSETLTYSNVDVLTVYSSNYSLFDFTVTNGSTGISNSDTVQILSALLVKDSNVALGTISQTIGSSTANVYILESNTTFGSIKINNTTYSNTAGYKILRVRPIYNDLTNNSITSSKWSISTGANITQGSNSANVIAIIGSGARATVTTDINGVVTDCSLTSVGSGYIVLPYVTVQSSTGTVNNLDIQARNYKAQVTVCDSSFNAGNTQPVGNGYAFTVTEGVIYQKGHFLRVEPQTIVVNAYSSNVDGVTVGFVTSESIVNSAVDNTLLDTSLGSPNERAPGANRLKMVPTLAVVNTDTASANNSFFPLVEFREGVPYKEFKYTQYNVLGKEFETRSNETNGNFVVDPFIITTTESSTFSNTEVDIIVDPGLAYINGKRVEINGNTRLPLRRSTDVKLADNQITSFNYGNYIYVDELAGNFNFAAGDTVYLYSAAKNYISTNQSAIGGSGEVIGTARLRSLAYDSGLVGTSTGKYRMYIYDIRMNQGKSFSQARSIYYAGTDKGIADIVLTDDPTTGENVAVLNDPLKNGLTYSVGAVALRTANNINYRYRTTNTSVTISTTGIVSVTASDDFPYGNNATLTSVQRRDIILVPKANLTSTNTIINLVVNQNNTTVTGAGLAGPFEVGDYIKLYSAANTAQTMYSTVASIESSSKLYLANNWTDVNIIDGVITRHFPANVPIPLDDNRVSANLNGNSKTLTIDLGNTSNYFTFSTSTSSLITYTLRKADSQELPKTINRGLLVKLDLSSHPNSIQGPWSLGIPDVFRLHKVYKANSSVVNTNSTDVTRYFTVDTGNKVDYYDHGYLNIQKNTGLTLQTDDYLLVEFDAFTTSSPTATGFFSVESYVISSNNSTRNELGNTAVNIMEVPEMIFPDGTAYDLRDVIDFRPRVLTTANVTSTISNVTTNPDNTISFGSHDKIFPEPDSVVDYNISYYLFRTDRLILDESGTIRLIEGVPSDTYLPPPIPSNSINLGVIVVPPYPSLPIGLSKNFLDFSITKTSTDYLKFSKLGDYTIAAEQSLTGEVVQSRVYTMEDIAELDRRLAYLEDYVDMCCSENMLSNQTLLGDDGLERFKNSLFVDDFNDYLSCDITHPEFRCYIDQVQGTLHPFTAAINFQARFNHDDSTTLECLSLIEGDTSDEPGILSYGETIATMPIVGEFTVIDQNKQTGVITNTGQSLKFIGDIEILPSSFKVLLEVDVQVADVVSPPAPAPVVPAPTPVAAGKPAAVPAPEKRQPNYQAAYAARAAFYAKYYPVRSGRAVFPGRATF